MICGHCGHCFTPPRPPWYPRVETIVESCGLCPSCGWVTVYGTPAKVTVGSDSGPARPKDGQR